MIKPQPLSITRALIPPWLLDRWGLVGIALTLYILVFLAWTYFHWGGAGNISLIGNLAILPPMLLATFMAWRVTAQLTLLPRIRWVWFILGLSFFTNFMGNVVWTYLENVLQIQPFPSIADIFYLGSYPLMLWGLLSWPGMAQNRRDRLVFWLDLIIVLTGASMFVGYFLIVPTAVVNESDFLAQFLATAYPIWSLVLMGGIVSILYRRPSPDTQAVFLLLLIGTVFFLASDFSFGYTSLAGTYEVGGWVDVGWSISQLFFVLAALRQVYRGSGLTTKNRGRSLYDRLAFLLPFAAPILSYGLVLYITLTNFSQAVEWLFVAAVLLTVLIIARQLSGPSISVASLRTKLILTFVLVCVLSIGLVTFFTYLTLRSNAESAWQTLLLTTLIVLILTTGAAVILAQVLIAPISRLTRVAAQIAAGNLSTQAQVESRDEIGTLAGTFNVMVQTLSQTRQELQDSEALYRSLVDYSPDMIAVHSQEGRTLFINPAGVKLMGAQSAEEILSRPIMDMVPPDSREEAQRGMKNTLAGEPTPLLQQKMYRLNGTSFEAEFRAIPISYAGRRAIQFVMRDVTERKRAEEQIHRLLSQIEHQNDELERRVAQRTDELNALNRRLHDELNKRQQLLLSLGDSEARFRLLFEASPDAILLIDPSDPNISWPIVDCNEVACTMNGYSREELIGQSIDILNSSPGSPTEREDYLKRIREKGVLHYEAFHRNKAGHPFPVEVSTSLITFEGRELVLGIDRDITERKQTDLALQQAKEMAEAASRAKSEFLSRMSHELRTPMNAILGFAQLLHMSHKEPLTPTQKERVKQITKGGQHLLDLINEILDISRIEAGRLQISPEPVPIRESVQEVLDLTAPLAADRRIQLQSSLPRDAHPYVMADRQRFKQVLLNLLSNAVKYNYDGGFVMVSCEQTPATDWRISITDTGPGISQENIGRLFRPFERLVGNQSNVEGTGLGLALAKRLVELMEGRIGIESIVGQGSTFWIELPKAESQLDRLQRTGGTGELPVLSGAAHTILYVEDNIANFELIKQVLADYDQIKLLWAADPHAGVESARRHHPSLILLDLHLGGRDGAEILKQLKQDVETAAIPVIMVSADATPGQIERLTSLGAHSYLTKPLDIKRFIQVIEELLTEKDIEPC